MKKILSILLSAVVCIVCHGQDLAGTLVKGQMCKGVKYENGSEVPFNYYVSPGASKGDNAVYVLLEHDPKMSQFFEGLIKEGIIPEGIFIFIRPGVLNAGTEDGTQRFMRAEEFDQNGPEFSNFIVEELIPQAVEQAGMSISDDPDMHFISGGSSGGIMAWSAVWYRNDFFHKTFISSPTFSAMRGGEEAMVTVRKTEPRPIRVFVTSGTVEPDHFFGDSFYAACNAASALEYAGYDYRFRMYANGGHCFNNGDQTLWREIMTWMFENMKVTIPRRPVSFSKVVPDGSEWQEVDTKPVHKGALRNQRGTYSIVKGTVVYKPVKGKKIVLEGLRDISAIAFSSDLWRLYIADKSHRFIYAYTLDENGVPSAQYKLASLHLPHDFSVAGANDCCVSTDDRVFAATELGIQCIRSFGLTDVILPLPGDVPAERVWLQDGWLFAASHDKVYKRTVNAAPHDGKTSCKPSSVGYGSGFNYSRPHIGEVFEPIGKGTELITY